MFRKLNNVFRPNQHGPRGRDGSGSAGGGGGGFRSERDYHSACTVRLVRSTSMLVVGGERSGSATLKRSKSSVSIESTLYYYQRQEDRVWLYSQNQNCLEYLEALVALRRQYREGVSDLKSQDAKATVSGRKKPAPPPPPPPPPEKKEQTPRTRTRTRTKPSAPPVPTEEDTLQFFDTVIASCDDEPQRKPYVDDGHADVDFIVASSSAEHDLHSNWVLRVPRVGGDPEQKDCAKKKNQSGSTSSRLRLQRNPIHLPKVVESAFQTLRFKPKLKKQ